MVVGELEALPGTGAQIAIVDCAADLEQPIGTASRPAHLLELAHPTVHQEVGGSLGPYRASTPPLRCRSA
jgi:hypothetical protein